MSFRLNIEKRGAKKKINVKRAVRGRRPSHNNRTLPGSHRRVWKEMLKRLRCSKKATRTSFMTLPRGISME